MATPPGCTPPECTPLRCTPPGVPYLVYPTWCRLRVYTLVPHRSFSSASSSSVGEPFVGVVFGSTTNGSFLSSSPSVEDVGVDGDESNPTGGGGGGNGGALGKTVSYFLFFINCEMNSMGSGNMMVEFFSAEILFNVCRYLSCSADEDSLMTSEAFFSAKAALFSPSAAITCTFKNN